MKSLLLPFAILFSSLFITAQPLDMANFSGMKARNIGPAGMSGRVTAIDVVLSNPNRIFIGTASGGIWYSDNGGTQFSPMFDQEKVSSVGAIAINQKNPNEIWVGTGEGNPRNSLNSGRGIYRSIDGGKTWKLMGLEKTSNIHRIIIDKFDPKTLWVAAIGSPWHSHPERGVYKTTDGGKTWRQVLYVNESTGPADLIVDPHNPNKLICAMWEHQRQPWFFNSGGEGSGIYISYDGGENWKKVEQDKGLREGILGRIGLSFAPSQPDLVYALVESKKNGLYKSVDGGESWSLVSTKNIGGRPFYYADIFVDTQNENRLFNVHTFVDVSQDGGKNFERFVPTQLIHVDNHAWWQHPEDNQFIICGNDGGLCFSRDGGKTWDFPENIPIGQFYHIRVDNAVPYNVYGGMQDNGSWRGPSQVWRRKGIRNLYWNRIGVGDGFDAIPDPKEPRFGYSLLQGGSLLRYDLETGSIQNLKPFIGGEMPLRFNWNPGFAINPFDQETLYLGSQYLLKSTDKGASWTSISPDLTTNDPEKQKQTTSGGLTYDATGAENFTTILTVEPSPIEKGLIWVGTDDGKIHLTRDEGDNWTDLTANLKGVPKGSWVTQLKASNYSAGAAFVVINNYRRGDWKPYVYHTTDYGKTWKAIVSEDQVWAFCYAIEQDPVAPNLLFLGSEGGLYVSVDMGKNWTKWSSGFPTVPTTDLVIHPREHDLAIGTFGRAIWILDDIRPLRELAQESCEAIFAEDLHLFPVPDAYLANLGEPNGYRSTGNGIFMGENRVQGAMISYYIKEKTDKKQKVKIQIYDQQGNELRSWEKDADSGIQRAHWMLEQNGVRFPSRPKPKKDIKPGGRKVLPGTYTVKVSYGEASVEGKVSVIPDPKIPMSIEQMQEKAAAIDRFEGMVEKLTHEVDNLRSYQKSIALIKERISEMEENEALKNLQSFSDSTHKAIKTIMDKINTPEEIQGIYRNPEILSVELSAMRRALQNTWFEYTPSQEHQLNYTAERINAVMEQIKNFKTGHWKEYKKAVMENNVTIF